jgi:hypothetical protein
MHLTHPSARSVTVVAALLVAPLVTVVVLTLASSGRELVVVGSDLETYRGYGERLLIGVAPYRGFALEYPPLALLPMTLPALVGGALAGPFGGGFSAYAFVFAAIQGLVAVAAGGLLYRNAPRPLGSVATWAVLVLVAAVSVAWRYDLWPAVLVLAAVVAADRGRPGLAGFALGAGAAMKLFPIVVVPILVARALATGDRPAARRVVGATVVTIGAVAAVSWVVAGTDAGQPLTYQLDRGLQLESVGAGLLLLGHAIGGLPVSVSHEYGSLQVVAPAAGTIAGLSAVVEIALVGLVAALAFVAFRRDVRRSGSVPLERTAEAAVAILAALLVGSKVFSIQYVVWILPLVPLLRLPQRALGIAIAACSTLIYPVGYAGLWQLDPAMIALLDIRNGLLVGLLVWTMADLARARTVPVEAARVSARGPRRSTGGAPA